MAGGVGDGVGGAVGVAVGGADGVGVGVGVEGADVADGVGSGVGTTVGVAVGVACGVGAAVGVAAGADGSPPHAASSAATSAAMPIRHAITPTRPAYAPTNLARPRHSLLSAACRALSSPSAARSDALSSPRQAGQRLQVLVVVEGRVQQQVPRAQRHRLRDALAHVRLRAPDGHGAGHVGRAVDVPEPAAQAFLGAGAVVVDGQVEALGDGESGGVAVRLLEGLAHDGRVPAEVRDAGRARPHPAVAEARGAAQGGLRAPAEPHGRPRALHGLRLHALAIQPEEFAGEFGRALGPEGAHDGQRLGEAPHAPPPRQAEGGVALLVVADAEARDDAPAAEHVERGQRLRQLHGVALGQHEHGRAQPRALGDGGHVREEADGFEVAAAAEHLVERPQAVEAEGLGAARHAGHGRDVDGRLQRHLGQGEPDGHLHARSLARLPQRRRADATGLHDLYGHHT